jgi:hypothetical protein
MKPSKISVSYGRTINTGNFNSVRLDASIEVELEDGDTATAAYDKAFEIVKAQVGSEAMKVGK